MDVTESMEDMLSNGGTPASVQRDLYRYCNNTSSLHCRQTRGMQEIHMIESIFLVTVCLAILLSYHYVLWLFFASTWHLIEK